MRGVSLCRSLWGCNSSDEWDSLFASLASTGFVGIEGSLHDVGIRTFHQQQMRMDSSIPSPSEIVSSQKAHQFFALLRKHGLKWICGLYTSWSNYEGEWNEIPIECHIANFRHELSLIDAAIQIHGDIAVPIRINCHAGSDSFSVTQSVDLLTRMHDILSDDVSVVSKHIIPFCHETHRGRMFYSPWQSRHILAALPPPVASSLKFTLDLSHWIVVAERTLPLDILNPILKHVWHIHARIGTSQSPQVHDPSLIHGTRSWEQAFVHYFESVWEKSILYFRESHSGEYPTVTPEYGPTEDLYMPRSLTTSDTNVWKGLFDLNELILNEGKRLSVRFAE